MTTGQRVAAAVAVLVALAVFAYRVLSDGMY